MLARLAELVEEMHVVRLATSHDGDVLGEVAVAVQRLKLPADGAFYWFFS